MPAPVPTTLDLIFVQVLGRLTAVLRWPEERVRPFDPDDVELPAPQGSQLCYVWPETESNKLYPGAGRLDTRDTVRITVEVATQFGGDETQNSRSWLLDRTLGHVRARHAVLDALVGFWPGDAAQNVLTDEPLHPAGLSKPKRVKQTPGWGYSRVAFEAVYIVKLSNPTVLL